MKKLLGLTSILLATGLAASASPVTPTYSYFGSLPSANFGGTGIPNSSVATTIINNGADTITLGLEAHGRYSNPAVTDNSAGVYYATPGENYGNPATPTTPHTPSSYIGATWNFAYYINISSTGYTFADDSDVGLGYKFLLYYGTDASSLVSFDPVLVAEADGGLASTATTKQDSENLDFSQFQALLPFDPNANGAYSFELKAYNGDAYLGETAINVDVRSVSDTGSTVWLLGLGFVGLVVFGFRQKRLQAVS